MSLSNPTQKAGGTLKLYRPTVDTNRINLLVYGSPGSGKTLLAGGADAHPKLGPSFYINAEGGTMTLLKAPPATWDLKDPDDPTPEGESPETCLRRFGDAYNFLRYEKHGYKSVVLDTLGELIRIHQDYLAQSAVKRGQRQNPYQTELQDYNETKNFILDWIRKFRDLPMHFFVTCHSEVKTLKNGQDVIQPLIFEKLRVPTEAAFDIVGYLAVGAYTPTGSDKPVECRKLVISFSDNDQLAIHAKGRLIEELGGTIINPTMSNIYARIVKAANSNPKPNPSNPNPNPNTTGE